MKIKSEHYEAIKSGLDALGERIMFAKIEYQAKGLSDMRLRWDAFRAAQINGDSIRWQCDTLYPYLNDSHVDSALRHYFGHKA